MDWLKLVRGVNMGILKKAKCIKCGEQVVLGVYGREEIYLNPKTTLYFCEASDDGILLVNKITNAEVKNQAYVDHGETCFRRVI